MIFCHRLAARVKADPAGFTAHKIGFRHTNPQSDLARDPAKAQRLFGAKGPRIVRGDLSDTEALARGAADVDVVFHVAGLIAARTPADFYATNRDATARVVAAARRAAPRRWPPSTPAWPA